MIYDKLFTWQQELVDKIKYRDCYGLFLDCGLGKTPISLALAEVNSADKILVVSINAKAEETVKDKGSFAWWLQDTEYAVINKKSLKDLGSKDKECLILNYEYLFTRDKEKIKRGNKIREEVSAFIKSCYGKNVCVILDESHRIKNGSAMTSETLKSIRSLLVTTAKHLNIYLLSGTPFTQGFLDLHNQLQYLGCKMTKTEFKNRYCIMGNIGSLLPWQQPVIGYKNVDDLYRLIHQYGVTIKSKEVIKLPEQVFNYHEYKETDEFIAFRSKSLSLKDKRHINQLLDAKLSDEELKENPNPFYLNIDYPQMNFFADTITNKWLRARQLSVGFQGNRKFFKWYNEKRVAMLKDLLINQPANYVIFYNYSPELLVLYDLCEELGYNIDVYCGDIKDLTFYEKYSNLTQDEKEQNTHNVILANFASGSTGKNWQEYNNCIIFSLPLYKDYEQGIKRVHRIGQNKTTIYHFFIEENFLDKGMLKALNEKIDYSEEMFNKDLNEA